MYIYIHKDERILVNPTNLMRSKTSNGMFHWKEHQTLQENQRKYDDFLQRLRCHPERKLSSGKDNSSVKEKLYIKYL